MSDAVHQPLANVDVPERLARQLAFCLEIDKVKSIVRRNTLADASRPENDAEHQWHLAMMATVLAEHAARPVDVARVVTMVLVHDLVEIDAGDAFIYDPEARAAAAAREEAAADRIYGILPPDQEAWLRGLWEEFEANETDDARFARALDRMQPILQNAASGGAGWRPHGIHVDQVLGMLAPVGPGAPAVHDVVERMLHQLAEDGIIARPPNDVG